MEKINIKTFDLWLRERRYIKRKADRQKILKLFKKHVEEGKNVTSFEKGLEKLGWNEITIESIVKYLIFWNYRNNENNKLKGDKIDV